MDRRSCRLALCDYRSALMAATRAVDLAGENADRFVVDLSKPEGKLSGLQVEERLYELDRLAVYKLDTTREHRAVNYSADCKKISLIIQGISELAQYLEYERKHREVYEAFKHRNFQH